MRRENGQHRCRKGLLGFCRDGSEGENVKTPFVACCSVTSSSDITERSAVMADGLAAYKSRINCVNNDGQVNWAKTWSRHRFRGRKMAEGK